MPTAKRPEPTARGVLAALQSRATPARAATSLRFFKTGEGQYGAGDRFLGVSVPDVRALVRAHPVSLETATELLSSPWHEARQFAVLAMVRLVHRADASTREAVMRAYLAHRAGVNNWDLVDASAEHVMAPASRALLDELARSTSIWDRRIAVLATFRSIKEGSFEPTVRLAKRLLHDDEDLIHKAVGWMLREIGGRGGEAVLEAFLDAHAHEMPRTMLRYAVEKLPDAARKRRLAQEAPVSSGPRRTPRRRSSG